EDRSGRTPQPLAVTFAVPADNSWTLRAPMLTGQDAFGVGVVNGRLYAVGSSDGGGGGLATVEGYDPGTDTWNPTAPMPTARYGLAVAVVDGILYAIGGAEARAGFGRGELATVEAYDPTTDTWTPKAPMPTARAFLAVGVVNGIIYAVGGWSGATVEAYDPTTDTWTTKASMPTARGGLAVGVVNGILYATGGSGDPTAGTTVEAYDPAT